MATTVYEKLSASAITQQENNAKQHFTVVYLESISYNKTLTGKFLR